MQWRRKFFNSSCDLIKGGKTAVVAALGAHILQSAKHVGKKNVTSINNSLCPCILHKYSEYVCSEVQWGKKLSF